MNSKNIINYLESNYNLKCLMFGDLLETRFYSKRLNVNISVSINLCEFKGESNNEIFDYISSRIKKQAQTYFNRIIEDEIKK